MTINPYSKIETSTNFQTFEFESVGKKNIKKHVVFECVDEVEQIYNLALCSILDNGELDCITATKNGDMKRIFETLAYIVIIYTDKYPDRKIFIRGSDSVRTRQYQVSLSLNITDILKLFTIEGVTLKNEEMKERESFRVGKNYDGFILMKK